MELHYPRWEQQNINTQFYSKNNSVYSNIHMLIELYSSLSLSTECAEVKLLLKAVHKSTGEVKEVCAPLFFSFILMFLQISFTLTNNTKNPQPLNTRITFHIDKVAKVKYTSLVSYSFYEFYFGFIVVDMQDILSQLIFFSILF